MLRDSRRPQELGLETRFRSSGSRRAEPGARLRFSSRRTSRSCPLIDRGIHINYTIRPPLPLHASGPRGEARDDYDHEYANLGSSTGLVEPVDRTTGARSLKPFRVGVRVGAIWLAGWATVSLRGVAPSPPRVLDHLDARLASLREPEQRRV